MARSPSKEPNWPAWRTGLRYPRRIRSSCETKSPSRRRLPFYRPEDLTIINRRAGFQNASDPASDPLFVGVNVIHEGFDFRAMGDVRLRHPLLEPGPGRLIILQRTA